MGLTDPEKAEKFSHKRSDCSKDDMNIFQSLECPLILFKQLNHYVESWTMNHTMINNYYYLECSNLHWLN